MIIVKVVLSKIFWSLRNSVIILVTLLSVFFKCSWKSSFELRSSPRWFCVTVRFTVAIIEKQGKISWKLWEKITSWTCLQWSRVILHWNAQLLILSLMPTYLRAAMSKKRQSWTMSLCKSILKKSIQ